MTEYHKQVFDGYQHFARRIQVDELLVLPEKMLSQ